MTPEFSYAVTAIQAILAPAIMVSASGLLLLGLLNRYTVIFRARASRARRTSMKSPG